MKKLLLVCVSLSFAVSTMLANVNVQGMVTDAETGEPLIGVSILVQGTTTGTVTDYDGAYSLDVPDDAVLRFSYMGYKPMELKAQSVLNLQMESDAIVMQEVVSLGYSSVKKAELSSAAVTVNAKTLTDVTTSDVGQMLQGKIAGVQIATSTGQPGAGADIRVRGTGSITASAAPLFVVDGAPGGTFNPNDVESITVLKDAGATAIYGAAAAGGVIVVTTKSGKNKGKVNVDFKVTGGISQALFGNMNMMDGVELYDYHKTMFSSIAFKTKYPKQLRTEGNDWRKTFFKMGNTQDYYVAVSGSTEKTNYYVSMDYFTQKGTLIGTDYNKISARADVETELCKGLKLGIRTNFDNSNSSEDPSWEVLDNAYYAMPWDSPYDKEGNIECITSAKRADGSTWYTQNTWNGLHQMQYNYLKSKAFAYYAEASLHYQPLDWLSFHSVNRFNRSTSKWTNFYDPRTKMTAYPSGYLSITNEMGWSIGTTNTVKAGYTWGQHSLNGIVGFEYGEGRTEYNSAEGTNMPDGMDELDACVKQAVGSYAIPTKGWSVFVQAQYDYAKRYFLTASYRCDASSIFGSKNRVGHFPSVAASWMMTNEHWMDNVKDVMNTLKIRASYGLTGNDQIPAYQYLSVYGFGTGYQNTVGATLARLGNDELRWETAYMAALGLDFGFLKDRVNFSIDLYNTDNKDLLLNVPLAPSSGFASVMMNRGSVNNQGIELQFNSTNIKRKHFTWDMAFNIGMNRNRVTELPDHQAFLQTQSGVSQIVREGQDIYSWYMKEWAGVDPQNGDPLWYMVDENENYVLDENGNKTTTNDYNATHEKIVGKATPLFAGGFYNSFQFYGVEIGINTTFQYGNKIFNFNREATDADGAYLGHNQMSIQNSVQGWTRWQNPGDIATHPKAVANGNLQSNAISSRYLEDGSYFRVKNITIAYNLQPKVLKKAHMTHCRFYITADNLYTATKFSGMDPEVSITTTSTSEYTSLAGLYTTEYPSSRQFLVGVEIGF